MCKSPDFEHVCAFCYNVFGTFFGPVTIPNIPIYKAGVHLHNLKVSHLWMYSVDVNHIFKHLHIKRCWV